MGNGWMSAQSLLLQQKPRYQELVAKTEKEKPQSAFAGPADRRATVFGVDSAEDTGLGIKPFTLLLTSLLILAIGLSIASVARGSSPAKHCDAVGLSGEHDEWALLEYEVDSSGIRLEDLSLEGSSTWDYGDRLKTCATNGKTHLPRNGLGTHTLFRYRPSSDLTEEKGRRLDFRPPRALANSHRPLDGNLALRLEIDSHGDIRLPEILFASDSDLGALVLDHLRESLRVTHTGRPATSRVDIVYLRFHEGDLVAFSQLHYSRD